MFIFVEVRRDKLTQDSFSIIFPLKNLFVRKYLIFPMQGWYMRMHLYGINVIPVRQSIKLSSRLEEIVQKSANQTMRKNLHSLNVQRCKNPKNRSQRH